jgi:hypothetical protein
MKFCIDCRFSNGARSGRYPSMLVTCDNPQVALFNPVDGRSITFCELARHGGKCGPLAACFEPMPLSMRSRPPPPWVPPIRSWFQRLWERA